MQDTTIWCLIVPFLLQTKKLKFPLVSENPTLIGPYVCLSFHNHLQFALNARGSVGAPVISQIVHVFFETPRM